MINEIKRMVNIIFDKNDAIENNIQKNNLHSANIQEINEIIEFLNLSSKRGITAFVND